jgi:hypothetical protein
MAYYRDTFTLPLCSVTSSSMLSSDILYEGRAIAQAVSRWLPNVAVRGSRPGRHVGFCGGQSGAEAGFLRVLRFPLPNSFHQLLQKIIFNIINQDMYNRPNGQTSMAAVQGPNRHLGTQDRPRETEILCEGNFCPLNEIQ